MIWNLKYYVRWSLYTDGSSDEDCVGAATFNGTRCFQNRFPDNAFVELKLIVFYRTSNEFVVYMLSKLLYSYWRIDLPGVGIFVVCPELVRLCIVTRKVSIIRKDLLLISCFGAFWSMMARIWLWMLALALVINAKLKSTMMLPGLQKYTNNAYLTFISMQSPNQLNICKFMLTGEKNSHAQWMQIYRHAYLWLWCLSL